MKRPAGRNDFPRCCLGQGSETRSYGYLPLYFLKEKGRLSAVIPMMEVVSILTGRRAVSLPFTGPTVNCWRRIMKS